MSSSSVQNLQTRRGPHDERIPKALLRIALAMVLFSLALASYARLTGMEPASTPDDSVGVVQERMIQIESEMNGSAIVRNPDGSLVADLDPTKGGFVSGIHRSLTRERMLHKIEGNPPVRIVRFADGRLGLRDPATGWRVELIGFGDTNRDAFAALLQ